MPSGYTSDIADGKDVSFNDFALKCARAFGACIEQRDDNANDKPKLIERNNKDNYHLEKLEKAKMWKSPTKEEFDDYVTKQSAYYNEQIDKQNKLKVSYEDMLIKVNKWVPPTTDHEGLKKFMIEQLSESLTHDCCGDYYQGELSQINSYTHKEYVDDMMRQNNKDIEYHTNELKKDNERVDTRNAWISALYKSLEN
jgi:hypothetical protein